MRQPNWVREPGCSKPNTLYRGLAVNATGINGKVVRSTRGDLSRWCKTLRQKSAEGIVTRERAKART